MKSSSITREQAIDFLVEHPAEFGHMLGFTKLGDLHNEWIKSMIAGDKDETLQAHRNSYKTTCVSISLADIVILFPNLRTLFLRKTDSDVKEIIRQVQNILRSPVARYFSSVIWGVPVKLTTESATEIKTNLTNDIKGTAQVVGMGIGSSITGKHFDRIFTDDIVNVDDRYSRADRQKTIRAYQELQNVINQGYNTRIFNTGTPWHKDDCFTIMPAPKRYDCYSTGIMSAEEIEQKKASMTSSLFAANYELKHIADEDVIFANPQTGADPSLVEQARFCHLDAAYGGEDFTAFTICNKRDGKFYVYGKIWRKHVDDCLDEIQQLRQQYMGGKILLETNGDKGYLARELKTRGERTGPYHENMNKDLKITTYLKGAWQDVVFVEGTDENYIDQICDYNDHCEHDDAPDSLSSIIRHLWKAREAV